MSSGDKVDKVDRGLRRTRKPSRGYEAVRRVHKIRDAPHQPINHPASSAMKPSMQNEDTILDYYLDESTKKDIHRGIDHFFEIGGGFCNVGRYSDVCR